MKKTVKHCSFLTAVFLLASSVTGFAETASNVTLMDAAISASEDVTVSREAVLDYPAGQWTMNYQLTNNGTNEAVCYVEIPVSSTLAGSHQALYTASQINESGESTPLTNQTWFTPLFSSAGISEETISAEQLREFSSMTIDMPVEAGTLYTIDARQPLQAAAPLFTITALTEESCQIYPIGCSYTASEGTYQISLNKGQETGYLFLIGEEGNDFSMEEASESDFLITANDSSLENFIHLSCEIFLNQTPMEAPITKELLADHLASYLNSSAVTVSLDLVPSLQWLVKQQLFEVYSYKVVLQPQETATVSIVRNCELPVNAVFINPVLTNNGKKLETNTISIRFPDEYTGASLRKAKGKFDKETAVFTLTDTSDGTYQIVLNKTPIWEISFRYIVPMSAAMAVFLGICLISYLGRKKAQTEKENGSPKNNEKK
ncbi:MAG: hypothetical protein IJ468_03295 [Lachnospiraceae bacterium]|nr:hypothetical protein [Lachnospiraceae bacterium]